MKLNKKIVHISAYVNITPLWTTVNSLFSNLISLINFNSSLAWKLLKNIPLSKKKKTITKLLPV